MIKLNNPTERNFYGISAEMAEFFLENCLSIEYDEENEKFIIYNIDGDDIDIVSDIFEIEYGEIDFRDLNKLYNGKPVTLRNVIGVMQEVDNIGPDDMTDEEKNLIRRVVNRKYDGALTDLTYLTDKLNSKGAYRFNYLYANNQTIYDILSDGDWYWKLW